MLFFQKKVISSDYFDQRLLLTINFKWADF